MNKLFLVSPLFLMLFFFSACKKEDAKGCTDANANNYDVGATEEDGSCTYNTIAAPYGFETGYSNTGFLNITKFYQASGTYQFSADAFFLSGTNNLVSAGALKLRSTNSPGTGTVIDDLLFNKTTGLYSTASENNLDANKNYFEWMAQGSVLWPAFNIVDTSFGNLPEIGVITSATTISASSDFTITLASATNNDTIVYSLYGPNTQVIKREAGNATSCVFTAAELSALGMGTAQLVVVGRLNNTYFIGSKTYTLNRSVYRSVSGITITP